MPRRTTYSRKKKPLILEDTDSDDDEEEDSESSEEEVQMKTSQSSRNKNSKSKVKQSHTPSSVTSGGSSTFRLTCRVSKTKTITKTISGPRPAARTKNASALVSKRTQLLASARSSSCSSSSSSESENFLCTTRQQKGRQKNTKTIDKKTLKNRKLDISSSSDSSIEFLESRKKPPAADSKQLDSDSDDSILVPAASLVIQKAHKSKQANLLKEKFPKKSSAPVAMKRRIPPPQPVKRNPPVQPIKRDPHTKEKSGGGRSDCSSSSGESSALRRVARKCARLPNSSPEDGTSGSHLPDLRYQASKTQFERGCENLESTENEKVAAGKNEANDNSKFREETTIDGGEEEENITEHDNDNGLNNTEVVPRNLRLNFDLRVETADAHEQPNPPRSKETAAHRKIGQHHQTNDAVSKKAEQRDEFVLPDFASSSSESSDEETKMNTHQHAASIPSMIGLPLSTKNERPTSGTSNECTAVSYGKSSFPNRESGAATVRSKRIPNNDSLPSSNYEQRRVTGSNNTLTTSTRNPKKPTDEEEMEEAFFVDTEQLTHRATTTVSTGAKANKVNLRQQEEEAFFYVESSNVVDLCQGDDEEDETDTKTSLGSTVHKGLRVPSLSPSFNRRSREFSGSIKKSAPFANNDDDIIDFSDDENAQALSRNRPRRVTDHTDKPTSTKPTRNAHQSNLKLSSHSVKSPFKNNRRSSSNSFEGAQSFVRPSLPEQWQSQPAKRRRVRDATNSNPFFARSVTRVSGGGIRPTNDENVFYQARSHNSFKPWNQQATFLQSNNNSSSRNSNNYRRQPLRNDLAGGSGVGAGTYTFANNYNVESDHDDYYDRQPAGRRGRGGRTSATGRKKSASRRGGGKRTKGRSSGSGGKRGGYRRGGRGRRGGGRTGGGGGGGIMESAGVDPLLQHVGGADKNF